MTEARSASLAKASLMGAALIAVLSATPYVNNLNACCCALVLAGGLFASWILHVDSGGHVQSGQAAAAGAFAGLLGGLVTVPLQGLVLRVAYGEPGLEQQVARTMEAMREAMRSMGTAPPGTDESMVGWVRAAVGLDFNAKTVMLAILYGMVFSLFGLLGGLLGAALMRGRPVKTASPGPPSGLMLGPGARTPAAAPPAAAETTDASAPLPPDAQPPLPWSDDAPAAHAEPGATGDGTGPLAPHELPLLPREDGTDPPRGEPDETPGGGPDDGPPRDGGVTGG